MCSPSTTKSKPVVLGINKEEQKISLGVRQLDENPWDDIDQRYPIGSTIKGQVRNLTAYGAFVEMEDGIDGMIHVSDLSWTRKVNHPSEILKKGDEVEAIVIEIDKANQRISLGMKQLEDDPWSKIGGKFKVGDLVKGTVAKIASFGAFIQLEDEIDGLVHISQLSEEHVTRVKDVINVGDEVEARVIKVDNAERRIGLSIKAANYSEEQLEKERAAFEALRPSGDMVGLEQAFKFAQAAQEEWTPGEEPKPVAPVETAEKAADRNRRRIGRTSTAYRSAQKPRRRFLALRGFYFALCRI